LSDVEPVYAVFNPRSGKGRGAKLIAPVLRALGEGGGRVEHGVSAAAGDEARLAAEAAARGFRRIVAVGGDGTWSNVGNAILHSGADASLGLIPGGTGCDLAKSLGIPARDLAACARVIREGHTRRIDVGRVEGRYFLNVVGFGFDMAVIEDSLRVRYLGGEMLYLYCALRQIVSFPGFEAELVADGVSQGRRELLMLIVANARVFGGGFEVAPGADLEDGRLDAVAFANMPAMRRLGILGRLLRARHEAAPEVRTTRAACYRLRFDKPPAYETDGEWNQAREPELGVEAVPAALQVLVPRPA
jgi:YegS/Rv2252/BmrU family lipid kinase